MTYIGIDASISSTAITILDNDKEYYFNYTSKEAIEKWFKVLSGIKYHVHTFKKVKDYSENEVYKILQYDILTTKIVEDIFNVVKDPSDCIVAMEGYSFGRSGNSLIDLVTFSTILRTKILAHNIKEFKILAPSTLKLNTCKMVYNAKKSPDMVSGGRFQKHDMLKAILDFNQPSYIQKILLNYPDLLKMANIPKPIDDIVDSLCIAKTIQNKI